MKKLRTRSERKQKFYVMIAKSNAENEEKRRARVAKATASNFQRSKWFTDQRQEKAKEGELLWSKRAHPPAPQSPSAEEKKATPEEEIQKTQM